MINDTVNVLYNYRISCAQQSQPSQLILPDSLKLLPLYMLSALKSHAFRLLTHTKLDEKIASIYRFLSMPISLFPYVIYPRVYKISDILNGEFGETENEGANYLQKPICLPASFESV